MAREISVAPRAGAMRKNEGPFVEGLRNLVRRLFTGRLGDVALAAGFGTRRAYDEVEARQRFSLDAVRGAILAANSDQLLLLAEYLFAGTGLAFTVPPSSSSLAPSPTAAVASALPLVAEACEAAALAQADGVMTPSEAEAITETVDAAMAVLATGKKSARVAAGMELANG